MLIDFIGKPVSLQVESNLSQEQYDIVLMQGLRYLAPHRPREINP